MKHSALSSLSVLSLMIGTLTLVGCGGAFSLPDAVVSTSSPSADGPPINGSVYGGHAPVQGAHVYLLQPSTTAYGGLATSILGNNGATSANGYAISTDVSDPKVPVGSKYVTTDSSGQFSLTGAYACQVGQPVYIYAYGGNIGSSGGTPVAQTGNITISKATVAFNPAYYPNSFTYTFTFSTSNSPTVPLAVGDTVNLSLSNITADGGTGYNWPSLTSVTVASVNSPTNPTQFTAVGSTTTIYDGAGTGTYSYSSTAVNNPSIVQLLTLGNCPQSGNFSTAGNGALQYLYVNEVSTVATAYTFQPFTLSSNNDAWHIGSTGGTQALLGIANAANTAAQLYNIQGGGQASTAGDGEGHVANFATAAGNGIVPEATINTLANILANCVDAVPSTPTSVPTQCSSLFSVATDDGTSNGTTPVDTGTAAINIARYPAGNHSTGNVDATYVSDIYANRTSIVPYLPQLNSAPHDWTIAINYPVAGRNYTNSYSGITNPYFAEAESLAIDNLGQVWVTGQGENSIVRLTSLGAPQPSTAQTFTNYAFGYVSVDGSNNAWAGSTASTTGIFEAGGNGVFNTTYGSGYFGAYLNIADQSGDDYFFTLTTGTSPNYQMFEYPNGSSTSTTPTQYSISTSSFASGVRPVHGAIDASGDFWLTAESSPYQIARVTSSGAKVWSISTGVQQPEFPSIDASGNGWIPSQTAAGPVYKISSNGTSQSLTNSNTGATWAYPFGSAIDGNGNVWITNRCGAYNNCGSGVTSASSTIVELNGSTSKAISPSTNYLPQAQYPASGTTLTAVLPDPLNLAIDPSGNIWITNFTNNTTTGSVVEIVGAAAPVVTPLSVAAGTNKLGQKPN
jgi:hypothetical protein